MLACLLLLSRACVVVCRDAMALVHSRIRRVVYVHSDPVFGALGSRLLLHEESKLNHHYTVSSHLCVNAYWLAVDSVELHAQVYQATPQTTTISGK